MRQADWNALSTFSRVSPTPIGDLLTRHERRYSRSGFLRPRTSHRDLLPLVNCLCAPAAIEFPPGGLEHGTNDSNCAFSRKGFRERGLNPTHFAWVTWSWMRNQFWIGQYAPDGRSGRKSCRESRLEWPIACRECVGRHCNTVVLRIPRQLPNSVELLGPGLLFITNLPAGVAVWRPLFHFDTSAIGRISREGGARQPRSRGIMAGDLVRPPACINCTLAFFPRLS